MAPGPVSVSALVALLCLIWGSTWLVIREGLDDLPPLTSAAARFVVAFVVMAAIAGPLARREGGHRPAIWLSVVVGALNFALSYGIVYTVETVLPSGLVSVLWAVFPLMMAIFAHLLLDERLRMRHWIGFGIGFGGVAMLFVTDLAEFGPAAVPTALWLFVSPFVSAVGQTCVKRYGAGASSVLLTRNAMAVGALLLCAAALAAERDAPMRWTAAAIGSIAYLAVVGTCLTFTLFFWLLRYTRASRLSVITFVTPLVALSLGALVRGEPVTATTIAGAVLVLLGVALVVRAK